MARRNKLLDGMRRNPRRNWTIEHIITVCRAYESIGVSIAPPKRGSHYTIRHSGIPEILTIPARRPIKPVYVKRFVSIMDSIISLRKETPE